MKKHYYLTLLTASTLFLSNCRSDSNESTSASIVGVWKIQKSQTINGTNSTTIMYEYVPQNDCEKKTTMELTSDNKYISKEYGLVNNVCTLEGNQTLTYTYDKNTKKLTSGNQTVDVLELTATTLIVSGKSYDYNGDGITDISKTYWKK